MMCWVSPSVIFGTLRCFITCVGILDTTGRDRTLVVPGSGLRLAVIMLLRLFSEYSLS